MVGRTYRFRMRVPKRFAVVERRKEIDLSLKTSDLLHAEAKGLELEKSLQSMWEARMAGQNPDYEAIVKYCQAMGFAYRPIEEQNDDEFLSRMKSLDPKDKIQAQSLMGTVKSRGLLVSKWRDAYERIDSYRLQSKNEEQRRIWRIPFNRAAALLGEVCGDLQLQGIKAHEGLPFRDHLRAQVEGGKITANTANRMIGSLQKMFKEICRDEKLVLVNPFNDLRLREAKTKGSRKAVTPDMIKRILALGAKREHVQNTHEGRRLFFKRTKTGNSVAIPVTPALAELIDSTPNDQEYLVVSLEGRQLRPERASCIVRDLRQRVNKAAEDDHTKIRIRDELHLYDMRGTAATELLRAGCSLQEIAVTMGWGLRHAGNIIERYAALVPETTDEVLRKLTLARKKTGTSK